MPERGPFGVRIRHIVVATLAISLIAVVLIVALNSNQEDADIQRVGAQAIRNEWADADALLPADDFSGPLGLEWIPFRPRESVWSESRIEEHWLDPAPVGRDVLDNRVEQRIDGIFEEVP
jgi:hypothetical protein